MFVLLMTMLLELIITNVLVIIYFQYVANARPHTQAHDPLCTEVAD